MKPGLILVGVGPHAREKYVPLIKEQINSGLISYFDVIELETERERVNRFFTGNDLKPRRIVFVPDRRPDGIWFTEDGSDAIRVLSAQTAKVLISTEPKAHFGYIKAALDHGLDCLVDKPVIIPMRRDAVPDAQSYVAGIAELLRIQRRKGGRCTVMAPRRYNAIYRIVQSYAARVVNHLRCPITYVGIQHHEGVWNTGLEIQRREDHPYKYGYGMLCHSGYHYIDVLSGFVELNEHLLGPLQVQISARSMSALDQVRHLPHSRLRPEVDAPQEPLVVDNAWGETDLVAIGTVRTIEPNEAVSLFSVDLLQTSASLRTWRDLPSDVYNKNGRFASEVLRVNIGTIASIEARILKVPRAATRTDAMPLFTKEAEITLWRNGPLISCAPFRRKHYQTKHSLHGNADLRIARRSLFVDWLQGRKTRSDLVSHVRSSILFEQVLVALKPSHATSETCLS